MRIDLHAELPSQVIAGPRVAPPLEADLPGLLGDPALPDPERIEEVLVALAKADFAADDPGAVPLADPGPVLVTDLFFAPRFFDPIYFAAGDPARSDPDHPGSVRREHDLAVTKTRADLVVLGAPAPPPPPVPGSVLVGNRWTETVRAGGAAMSETFFDLPGVRDQPLTFGWQRRETGARGRQAAAGVGPGHAGFYGSDPPGFEFDPARRLAVGFNNLFHSGGRYLGDRPPFAHPPAGSAIEVETAALYDPPGPGVPVPAVVVRRLHLPAVYPELVARWRDRCDLPRQERVAMAADTVVFDKASGRFTVTWRAVWPLARVPVARLRSLAVEGGP